MYPLWKGVEERPRDEGMLCQELHDVKLIVIRNILVNVTATAR